MLKQKPTLSRRELLCGTAVFALLPLSSRVSAQGLEASYTFTQLTNVGSVFNLPDVTGSIGVLGCSDLAGLAAAYRSACQNLNSAKLAEVKAMLMRLTQSEVLKLQNSVDLSDGKTLAERIGLIDGILTAVLGACVIGAGLFASPAVVAGVGAASLIYGFGVSPAVGVVKTALSTGQGTDILWSWANGRGTGVALQLAEASAEQKGKLALKGLISYGAAVFDVFKGLSEVIQGLSNIQGLEAKVNAAAARAMDLQISFLPVLHDDNALRNMLCSVTEASATALDAFASENSASDCRFPSLDIHFIRIKETAVIIRG